MKDQKGFFIAGTGTEVGKTLVSLGLCLRLNASYWKPIQTGYPGDLDFIQKFLPRGQSFPSTYVLKAPLSPNQASEMEGVCIDLKNICRPPKSSFLIVEGIGGLYVPINAKETVLDLIRLLDLPVILVAKSGLGTLNHSLLSLSILKQRGLKTIGLILSGPPHPLNKRDIEHYGGLPVLLELDQLPSPFSKNQLLKAFQDIPIKIKDELL